MAFRARKVFGTFEKRTPEHFLKIDHEVWAFSCENAVRASCVTFPLVYVRVQGKFRCANMLRFHEKKA